MRELLIASVILFIPSLTQAQIFSEIMFNPEGTDAKNEWVEVFNDTDLVIDLAEYGLFENSVNHGISHYQGPTELLPDSYAVIAGNAENLSSKLDSDTALFDSVFTLNNTGEEIKLLDANGSIVTIIRYDSEMGGNGDGNSLNLIAGTSWQPRKPSPGNPALENQFSPSLSTSSTSKKTLQPIVQTQQSRKADYQLPGFGIAEQKVEFKIHNPVKGYQYNWKFNDGTGKIGPSVARIYKLPGNYSLDLIVKDDGETIENINHQIQIEPPKLGLSTGYYKEKRYLRVINNNRSILNISNWQIVVGKQTYKLPSILRLAPDDSYAFNLDAELEYPIVISDDKAEVVLKVESTTDSTPNETAKIEELNSVKPIVPVSENNTTLIPEISAQLQDTDTTENDLGSSATDDNDSDEKKLEQQRLEAIFNSYSDVSNTESETTTSAPVANSVTKIAPVGLAANSNTAQVVQSNNFSPAKTIINVIMIMVLGAGLMLLVQSRAIASSSNIVHATKEVDNEVGDYEITEIEDDDF
jgi:hypothetical protein